MHWKAILHSIVALQCYVHLCPADPLEGEEGFVLNQGMWQHESLSCSLSHSH